MGLLDATSPQVAAPNLDAFRQGMCAQCYEEGQDYVLESRYSEGMDELLPDLAAELVGLPVDVMLASNLRAVVAAKNATATIPIVITNIGSDPVAAGLVESLAQSGGNVTGTGNSGVLLVGKRVAVPGQPYVGLLSDPMIGVSAHLRMTADLTDSKDQPAGRHV